MVPDLEKPRITEIQVRMDCNGCVQKIKKALHGINGIYDVYIDFPQQKLTIVGWADPEKIIKAIKKTRKIATVCVHTEVSEPQQQEPPPQPAEGGQPPQDATTQPPTEQPPPPPAAEQPPQENPPQEQSPAENPPPPETTPPPPPADAAPSQPAGPSEPKDVESVHIIHHHHHPHDYGYGMPWNTSQVGHVYRHEPPTPCFTHSYNNYRPSPYVSAYVTDHGYMQSPPPPNIRYGRMDHYADDYHSRTNGDGNSITSIFSDENPNACRIA